MSKRVCRICFALMAIYCLMLVSLSRPAGDPVLTAVEVDAERLARSVQAAQGRAAMLADLCFDDDEPVHVVMLVCARAGLHQPLSVRMNSDPKPDAIEPK